MLLFGQASICEQLHQVAEVIAAAGNMPEKVKEPKLQENQKGVQKAMIQLLLPKCRQNSWSWRLNYGVILAEGVGSDLAPPLELWIDC